MRYDLAIWKLVILIVGLCCFLPTVNAAPGFLDTSFSLDGFAAEPIGNGGSDIGYATVIQADGKIVVAGRIGYGLQSACGVARYNANGSLDTSFDGDGTAYVQVDNYFECYAAALQTDGKIVVAGTSTSNGSGRNFALARFNSNGSIDTSFDGDGKVTTSIAGFGAIAGAVVIQADGKIVAVGRSRTTSSGSEDFALVRYNPNGSLDTSFDGDGKVTTDVTGSYDIAYAAVIQPDGKIIAAGLTASSRNDFGLVRYNPDGSLDTTFDGDGKVTTSINGGAYAVALQPDGKIVAAGESNNFPHTDFGLVRYNSNGSLDTSFDGDGIAITSIYGGGNGTDAARAVAIQADGKIVAAGDSIGSNYDFAVVRYNANGTLDTSFDGDGKLTTDSSSGAERAYGTAIQADGKIITVGYFQNNGRLGDFALARYNTDGSLDTSFDGDGTVISDIGFKQTSARAVAIQPDGKIVSVGSAYGANSDDFAVVRHFPNGALDTSFDGDGKAVTPIGINTNDFAQAVVIQPDGKIVVVGYSGSNFALARYNTDGSLDASFDGDGKVTTVFPNGGFALAAAIQPDGKILAAGRINNSTDADFAVVRYNPNGSLDTTFDGDGIVTTAVLASEDIATAVAVQADGKIVAAGYSFNNTGTADFALVRYNSNGSLDTSFDGDGRVTTVFDGGTSNIASAVAIQSDGKIVASGGNGNGSVGYNFLLARYNANGSLDNSFDGDGKVTTFGGRAKATAIQPDGKIIAAGFTSNGSAFDDNNFIIVRYNSNGSRDNSYGIGGNAVLDLSGFSSDIINGMALDSAGRAVIVGESGGLFTVARITGDFARSAALFDFDGDGKSDISVFRPSNGAWYLQQSTSGYRGVQFGLSDDKPVPADFDGDGKTDIAVFRPSEGAWYRLRSSDNTFTATQFGRSEDLPVPKDYDGDGRADLAVFRPSSGTWYELRSITNQLFAQQFGANGDKPVSGDYDGDGLGDLAVYRGGSWYLFESSTNAFRGISFGISTDKPISGDFDGDGKTDLAVVRGDVNQNASNFYVLRSSDNGFNAVAFGTSTDIPAVGDYDGDGKTDVAVFRPSNGAWYLNRSTAGFTGVQFGQNGDKPIPSSYVP